MNETGHRFEDRLWDDLMAAHGPQLATAARRSPPARTHRIRWAGAGTLATIAALVGLFFAGSGSPAAFAVTTHPDGSVTISLRNVQAVKAANAALHRLHAHVVIISAGSAPTCQFVTFPEPKVTPAGPSKALTHFLTGGVGTITVPKVTRPGELITLRVLPHGGRLVLRSYVVRASFCAGRGFTPPRSSSLSNPPRSTQP